MDSNNKETKFSKNLIKKVEKEFIRTDLFGNNKDIRVGDFIQLGYKIPEGEKERIQIYEGLIMTKQNRGLGKSFTLRRTVQGIGIEQVFLLNSPKIAFLTHKQSSKVRRAKLYFLRNLSEKLTRSKLRD